MKQSINWRLMIVAVIAVITTAIGMTWVSYDIFQQQVRHDLQASAEILVKSEVLQNLYDELEGDVLGASQTLFNGMQLKDQRITWVDHDGIVLFDSETDARELPNHLDRPEIQEALENGTGEHIRLSDTRNLTDFYYAIRLDNGTVIRISTEARSILNVFTTMIPFILLIMGGILLVCVWLSHMLTASLLKPINEMAEHLDDDTINTMTYRELVPFADKIRLQHENILAAARSRQDFTANVSHELKTPLTAISGYAELIETGMVDTEQIPQIAGKIHHNSSRLLSLINDIIKLSELDYTGYSSEIKSLDLYKVAAECCKNLQINAVQKKIRLQIHGNSVMIKGDRDLLREMIANLIQNSIQYSNEGGYVNVLVHMENARPIIRVEDNGIGIEKDQQSRIFERFYRVDKSRSRATGGTGLGLAIVKHIAEIHNADISVDSAPGKGTRITISF